MVRVRHDKLVRDRVPEIIRKNGEQAVTRTLKSGEYKKALLAKLQEEAAEALQARSKHALVDELADVHEVLRAIYNAHDLSPADITAAAALKRKKRGSFAKRIFLIETK